jgi:uncharacterized protein
MTDFVLANPGVVDYVEIPFEQLRHSPSLAALQESVPLILHCASLSVAGFVPPPVATMEAIRGEAERMRTPWIGEHLAFVTADAIFSEGSPLGPPTSLTYTVCPQLSEETVRRVIENVTAIQSCCSTPLILENPPQYFVVPGSTMSIVDFVNMVLSGCQVGLLLDLSHFLIAMMNTGMEVMKEIARLPLERVREVHISGLSVQSGIAWDDHATPAPALVFELLEYVLARNTPLAITMEYNWSPNFPESILHAHFARIRKILRQYES